MLPDKVKNRLGLFRQYYFSYSKGFYHLPYIGSSPQALVKGFDRFPFLSTAQNEQYTNSNTPFWDGGFFCKELEEGCWMLYYSMKYKANVAYDLDQDAPAEQAAAENYYILSLNNVDASAVVNNSSTAQYSWTLSKPGVRHGYLFFEGACHQHINIYFSEEWLQKNLVHNNRFAKSGLRDFLQSDNQSITWQLSGKEAVLKNFDLFDQMINIDGSTKQIDLLHLKLCSLNLIFEFIKLCREQNVVNCHVTMDYNDPFQMNKLKCYLDDHLLEKFPGIDFLAGKFNISETRLKADFKRLFGKPVYQYFQQEQMRLAKEMLIENQLLIREISWELGYENTSKFTAAFKKHHGMLPSALQRNVASDVMIPSFSNGNELFGLLAFSG